MLRNLVLAVALFAATAASADPRCQSLDSVIVTAERSGKTLETINGASAVNEYHARIGVEMPAETKAESMFYVVVDAMTVIGLIEPDGTVCHWTRVLTNRHTLARDAVKVGA